MFLFRRLVKSLLVFSENVTALINDILIKSKGAYGKEEIIDD